MSQRVSFASMITDPVINEFSPDEVRILLQTYDNSIVNFVIRGLCLVFSNTSYADGLDRFIK